MPNASFSDLVTRHTRKWDILRRSDEIWRHYTQPYTRLRLRNVSVSLFYSVSHVLMQLIQSANNIVNPLDEKISCVTRANIKAPQFFTSSRVEKLSFLLRLLGVWARENDRRELQTVRIFQISSLGLSHVFCWPSAERHFSWYKITFCVNSLGANRLTILELQVLVNNCRHRAAVESIFLSKFVHCYSSIYSDKFFKIFKFSFVRRCTWHARTVTYVLPLLKISTPLYKFLCARQLPQ